MFVSFFQKVEDEQKDCWVKGMDGRWSISRWEANFGSTDRKRITTIQCCPGASGSLTGLRSVGLEVGYPQQVGIVGDLASWGHPEGKYAKELS